MESFKAGARFGEYLILRTIGKGGQGFVYEVEDSLGLHWALKLSRQIASQEAAVEERFRREARAVSERLSTLPKDRGVFVGEHYGIFEGRFYVKMRLLKGQSLAELLQKEGRLSLQRTLRMVQQVAVAVAAAHQRGVVHRDLKPENIFLTPDAVQVLDWGCLQMLELGQAGQTEGAGPMCTPGYAAPEQYQPGALPSAKMDSYALGVILFELLAGYHPFLRCGRLHPAAKSPSAYSPTAEASTAFSQLVHLPRSAQGAGGPSLGPVQYAKTEESEPVSVEPRPTPRAGLIPPPETPTEVLQSIVPEPGLSGPVTRTLQPEAGGLSLGAGTVEQPAAVAVGYGNRPLPLREMIELQHAGKVPTLPGIPQVVVDLVTRLVAVEPRRRPEVQELVALVGEELTRLGGEPLQWAGSVDVATLPSGSISSFHLSRRRLKVVATLSMGAVVTAGVAASLGLWTWDLDQGKGAKAALAGVEESPAHSGGLGVRGAPSAPAHARSPQVSPAEGTLTPPSGSEAPAMVQFPLGTPDGSQVQAGPQIQPAPLARNREALGQGKLRKARQVARPQTRQQKPSKTVLSSSSERPSPALRVVSEPPAEPTDSNKTRTQPQRPSLRLRTGRSRAQMRKRLESQLSSSVQGKGARKQ